MFVVTVLFEIHAADVERFRARVRRQAADSIAREPGCHRFDVSSDPERPTLFYLYEIYDDRAAFDAHLESAHFKSFNAEVGPWTANKTTEFWRLEDWPLET